MRKNGTPTGETATQADDFNAVVGERIRIRRETLGAKLADVAEAVDADISTLSKVERGERRITVDWLEKLGRALDCPASEFLPPEHRAAEIRDEEAELVAMFRNAEPRARRQMLNIMAGAAAPVDDAPYTPPANDGALTVTIARFSDLRIAGGTAR